MDLAAKGAIVTGGGTGVGRATALELARQGCSVLVNYSRSRDDAEATAAEVEKLGVRAIAHQADVSQDDACRAMVDEAVRAFGRLDILVNNAGTTKFVTHADLEGITGDDWDRILAVNLKGPFFCSRAAAKPMMTAGAGAIVNVASVAGIAAIGSSIPYAASKAGLINMTIALARVLAPTIRVNAVAPGFITGRWLEQGLGLAYDVVLKAMEDRAPMHRVCDPEDVADVIMSLITGTQMITGQTIVCDGGMLISG
ncbi:MAG: SDR family NAD(P)-dependent oxidoreductase [Pirellulales bacterium]